MAVVTSENSSIPLKYCIRKVSGLLIMSRKLDFQNSKWRIQYGGGHFEISFNFSDTLYTGVFGSADYKYEIKF